MTKYRLSFEIETDADPSSLLASLQDAASELVEHEGGEFDDDTASVEELS